MSYDNVYRKHNRYFGQEPAGILVEYHHLIDKGRPVLDIGAGQGRNAIYLGRKGYSVEAIEPSRVGAETLKITAEREGLPINVYQQGFEDFGAAAERYSAILIFGIIQEQKWELIHLLVSRIKTWLSNGDLLFASAFTTEDPSFERISKAQEIGKNSFIDDKGIIITFLEPNELLKLFYDFQVIFHQEGLGPVHHHGDGPPERHGLVTAVLRKK